MSIDEMTSNIARHPAYRHFNNPSVDSAYDFETIAEDVAYGTIAFWPACRLTDLWRKETYPGKLATTEFITPERVGSTILPRITLFEKESAGMARIFPANDGREDGSPENVLSIQGHLADATRMTSQTHAPLFVALISTDDAKVDFAGVILPVRPAHKNRRKSNEQHGSALQYCCCLAPI